MGWPATVSAFMLGWRYAALPALRHPGAAHKGGVALVLWAGTHARQHMLTLPCTVVPMHACSPWLLYQDKVVWGGGLVCGVAGCMLLEQA